MDPSYTSKSDKGTVTRKICPTNTQIQFSFQTTFNTVGEQSETNSIIKRLKEGSTRRLVINL